MCRKNKDSKPISSLLELLKEVDWEDFNKEMNRCYACGGEGKAFHTRDSTIVWCQRCGRLYVMPIHVGLCSNPMVPEWTKQKEREDE